MNRVCMSKTGKFIASHSADEESVERIDALLINTALTAGYVIAEIEVKWATDEELSAFLKVDKPIVPIKEQKRQAYRIESDHLYAEWQVLLSLEHPDAENRRLEWLAKRAEIAARFG